MIKYYSVNGKIVPKEAANLHIHDLSILRGYGVFDYFLVTNRQARFIEDNLDRFENSARLLDMELPVDKATLREQIQELIEINGLKDAAIRLVLTGGYSEDCFTPAVPNLLILEHEAPVYSEDKYEKGIKLMTYQYIRELPEAKTINYVTGIRVLKKQKEAGAMDVLYHDGEFISESARSNFFIVTKDNVIVTPKEGILLGVTRKHLLEAARPHFKIEERPLRLSELADAKEAFLTSATKGAMPVVQVDGMVIGNGEVGVTTRNLNLLFEKHLEAYLGIGIC